MRPFQRRLAAWLACFAVLLAALAPAISHAVNASRMRHAEQYCEHEAATNGQAMPARHAMPEHSGQAGHDTTLHFEHCPFCYTHAGSFALAPLALPGAFPAPSLPSLYPELFYRAPRALFAWSAQQPRAPPVLS